MGGTEVFIGVAFVVAGFIKGAVGIGLPTVIVGLLSIVMPPAQAAQLMVMPALATNIWQMASGPALGALLRRLAGFIVAVFVGTFTTIGFITSTSRLAGATLGIVLALYGAYALWGRRFQVERTTERWLAPVSGLVAGMLSGATGVFVIPTVPFLTSLRMTAEELVQAVGITAFVCPLALATALAVHGQYPGAVAGASLLALAPALAGMYLGIKVRLRLPAAVFMRWFFVALIALGGYMFVRAVFR
jgi:uncharacterized protein